MQEMSSDKRERIINEVFGSRDTYDKKRYIKREEYEKELMREINRYRYVFIIGESGSGKTWLTNYILPSTKKKNYYINLSEVGMEGGLINFLKRNSAEVKIERRTNLNAEIKMPVASGEMESETYYSVMHSYLWEYLEDKKDAIIVLDNFESIITQTQILEDLSSLITLADDPRMKEFNPKFIIIGALTDVLKYFNQMPNYQTIANRVATVEIKGFTVVETGEFVKKGFSECSFSSNKYAELSQKIYDMTGGFPQAVNDLCYYIAIQHLDANRTEISDNSDLIYNAQIKWIGKRMLFEYEIIRKNYNNNLKNDSLLNYILYVLRDYGMREFSVSEIRSKAEQTMDNENASLGVNKVKTYLYQLADSTQNSNILEQTVPDGFRIKSNKTLACLMAVMTDIDGIPRLQDVEDFR